MKLDEFFTKIAPLFDGRKTVDEVAVSLYGSAKGPGADRLRVYDGMCRWRRGNTLSWSFPRCYAFVLENGGLYNWQQIATEFFVIDPWRSLQPLPNTGKFPEYLVANSARFKLPPWLPEVADLEWWIAYLRVVPDDPTATDEGPLRLHPTVEIRPYEYNLAAWIEDSEAANREPPVKKKTAVVVWRNRKLAAAVDSIGGPRIRLLAAIQNGRAIDAALAKELSLDLPAVHDMTRRMWTRGILIGGIDAALGSEPGVATAGADE